MMTSSTRSGGMPVRSTRDRTQVAPSCGAGTPASDPMKAPMGVLTPATIIVWVFTIVVLRRGPRPSGSRFVLYDRSRALSPEFYARKEPGSTRSTVAGRSWGAVQGRNAGLTKVPKARRRSPLHRAHKLIVDVDRASRDVGACREGRIDEVRSGA